MRGSLDRPKPYMALAGFAAGFAALAAYHAWTRVLPPLFSNGALTGKWVGISVLLGIFLGSFYFRSRLERLRVRPRLFAFMQAALGLACVLAMRLLISLAGLPAAFGSSAASSATGPQVLAGLLGTVVLFVPAFLLCGILVTGAGSGLFRIFFFLGCALGAINQAFLVGASGNLWTICIAGSGVLVASGLIGFFTLRANSETVISEESGRPLSAPAAVCFGGFAFSAALYALLAARLIFLAAGHTAQASSILTAAPFAGLAAGSLLAAGPLRHRLRTTAWIGAAAGLTGLFGLFMMRRAGTLPLTFLGLTGERPAAMSDLYVAYCILALTWLVVPGVLLGSTLSLGTPREGDIAGRRLGAGAAGILAALAVGAFLPSANLGLRTLLMLGQWVAIASGTVLLITERETRRRGAAAIIILIAAVALSMTLPAWDIGIMTTGVHVRPPAFKSLDSLRDLRSRADIVTWEDSPAGLLSVERNPDEIIEKVDGTVRATTAADVSRRLSAHLPLLLHDLPRNVLVVGFGTGARLAAALAHPVESIECVEGFPGSDRVWRVFATHNEDALRDPRLTLVQVDPRNYLANAPGKYDLILLESPLPFTRRGGDLLTTGFFESLRSSLKPGGMVCQALRTVDLSPGQLGLVASTFCGLFPHVSVWWTGGFDIVLVGAMEPHFLDYDAVKARLYIPSLREDLDRIGISGPLEVLALFITDRAGLMSLGRSGASNTVLTNRLALDWPRQTLNRTEGDAFGALNEVSLDPLDVLKPSGADTSGLLAETGDLERCSTARDLYAGSVVAAASGDLRRAISMLDQAVAGCRLYGILDFPRSDYYMLLSRKSMGAGSLEEAVESARRAVELDPLEPATFHNLAAIELNRDPETAAALLGRAVELDPAYVPGYLLKARAELAAGRAKDATETVGHVLSIEPFNAAAHQLKGLSLIQRQEYEAGRLELEKALEGMPGDLDILEALAYSWLLEGRLDRARSLYEHVLELDPDRLATLNNYATVLAEQGDYEGAVEAWTRALALSPGNRDIMANIEEARQMMRR